MLKTNIVKNNVKNKSVKIHCPSMWPKVHPLVFPGMILPAYFTFVLLNWMRPDGGYLWYVPVFGAGGEEPVLNSKLVIGLDLMKVYWKLLPLFKASQFNYDHGAALTYWKTRTKHETNN